MSTLETHASQRSTPRRAIAGLVIGAAAIIGSGCGGGASEEWASWRGPQNTGASSAVGLITSWSTDGENLIWRQDFTGRSTPVVFDGRVCANGRTGVDNSIRETVACWNAGDGTPLWQRTFDVRNTTVPFTRVGWSSVIGDPETGYLYAHGVDGLLIALDEEGNTVWEWRLGEDSGRASGYGGRTQNPIIDGDQVILSNIGANWGDYAAPRHRFWSFDKRTGDVLWTSQPANRPWADANTQGTPTVAEIDGRRVMIAGGVDGWVYALDANTGAPIWEFQLSKRGINVTPVVVGTTVYIAHSEENVDTPTMGRMVAIDGAGSGDITATNELWRAEGLGVGFSSPAYHEGVVYVIDNSSNLIALDAESGAERWRINAGTVGKSSPVWADGRIYYTEVNGRFFIIQPGPEGAEITHEEEITMPEGRHAEIYGSPAIAYGRIYLSTENGIFCLGDPDDPFSGEGITEDWNIGSGTGDPASIQVVPAEVIAAAGTDIDFELRAFDANGNPLGAVDGGSWLLETLSGTINGDGMFRAAAASGNQAGKVVAELDGLRSAARLRVFAPLPWEENLESGAKPSWWMGGGRYGVEDLDGGLVLRKGPSPSGLHRHVIYLGPDSMTGYTVQADLMGTRERRRRPDLGLINGGYTLDLQGNYQRLELRAWASELRIPKFVAPQVPFEWTEDTWYTMKLRVDVETDKSVIRAKVWARGTPEPEEWTIRVEDPMRISHGAPGIYGYSPVDIFFDNVRVQENQ